MRNIKNWNSFKLNEGSGYSRESLELIQDKIHDMRKIMMEDDVSNEVEFDFDEGQQLHYQSAVVFEYNGEKVTIRFQPDEEDGEYGDQFYEYWSKNGGSSLSNDAKESWEEIKQYINFEDYSEKKFDLIDEIIELEPGKDPEKKRKRLEKLSYGEIDGILRYMKDEI